MLWVKACQVATALTLSTPRSQDVGRILPAPPPLAVDVAKLPALGRVDTVQPDPLAMNLDGVAVDHRRLAGHVGEGDGR